MQKNKPMGKETIQLYQYLIDTLPKKIPTKSWWASYREQGQDSFITQGLPTNKWESYRHTPIERKVARPLTHKSKPLPKGAINDLPLGDGYHLKIVNGVLAPPLALPAGVAMTPFSTMSPTEEKLVATHLGKIAKMDGAPFVALNAASFQEGFLLTVAEDTILDKPIYLHHIIPPDQPTPPQSRYLLHIGKRSQVQIIECPTITNDLNLFTNEVCEIILEKEARLDHYLLQVRVNSQTRYFRQMEVMQQEGTTFNQHTFTCSGTLIRNHLGVHLQGKKSIAHLYGSYFASRQNHIEQSVLCHHHTPCTTGHTLYKAMVTNQATAVFNGYTKVAPQAQKSEASQYHHGWLQGNQGRIYARPELSIEADDILCKHGVTVEQVDEKLLFYLASRNIPPARAKELLRQRFFAETLQAIPLSDLRKSLTSLYSHLCQELSDRK